MFAKKRVSIGVAALLSISGPLALAAPCAPQGADPVDAIRQMYAAITLGDRAATLAQFDHDAYLFDVGTRFTPESLTDLILKAEAAGTKPQWHVDQPESHQACDTAWATWTNHGTFTTSAGTQPRTWLESAVFTWADGAWKIRFFHSTEVVAPHA
jgi:ketosteroid isomerase-like protein